MPAAQEITPSRTTPEAPSAPDQFVIDQSRFVGGDDDAYSMSKASRFFGSSPAPARADHYADIGVVRDGFRYVLPTFASSEKRRKTSRRACEWFQRVLDGEHHAPATTSADRAGLERTRALVNGKGAA